jgi:hypothetical protein
MLYLDQRGTGLSTPISAATLALQGDIHRQADYLKLFRADSIVKDCEAIRKTLTEDYPSELKKWSILGQSFGGFCVLTVGIFEASSPDPNVSPVVTHLVQHIQALNPRFTLVLVKTPTRPP